MRRNLWIALGLIAGACMPARAKVVTAPATSATAKCSQERASTVAYVVDGKRATCEFAMALSADRIASVEVLKGPAAVSRYGASAEGGVIVIQTKR